MIKIVSRIEGGYAKWASLAIAPAISGWFQQFSGALSSLMLIPISSRYLGVEAAGVWVSMQAFVVVAYLTDFGIGFTLARRIAFHLGGRRVADVEIQGEVVVDELLATRRINLFVCLVAFVFLLGFGSVYIYGLVKGHRELMFSSFLAWGLLSTSIVIKIMGRPYYSVLDGGGGVVKSRLISGGVQLLVVVVSSLVIVMGGGLALTALVYLCGALLEYFLVFSASLSIINVGSSSLNSSGNQVFFSLLKESYPLGVINISAFLFSSIQVPVIGATLGPGMAAAYFLLQRLFQTVGLASQQLVVPILPRVSFLHGSGQYLEMRSLMRNAFFRQVLVLAIGVGFVVGLYPFISKSLFRVERLSLYVVGCVAVDMVIQNICSGWGYFVLSLGRNPFMRFSLAAGVFNVVVIYCFLPTYGLVVLPLSSLIVGCCTMYSAQIYYGAFEYRTVRR